MRHFHTLSTSTWVIGLVFTTFFFGAWYTAPVHADTPEDFAADMIELTNAERVAQGLPPLKFHQALVDAALWKAQDMAANDYFDHTDSLGRTADGRMQAFGYNWMCWGENIGAGGATPAAMFDVWMNSDFHRSNILSTDYREIGVGYTFVENDTGTIVQHHYWTQNFGARQQRYPVIISNEAASTDAPQVQLYIYGDTSITEMRIRNEGKDWGDWQPYQSTTTWELATGSAGTRTVHIELRQGDNVLTASDSIELTVEHSDAPPPTTPPTATPTETPTDSGMGEDPTPEPDESNTNITPRLYLPLVIR